MSTKGKHSVRGGMGRGQEARANYRNVPDTSCEGSASVPLPVVSDRGSVSESDSQANFVVPVKHGSMSSQPRRKAVSEFVMDVLASLAQSSPPSVTS